MDKSVPARLPPSTSAILTHSLSVCAEQPILAAIEQTAAHRDGCSASCSVTIRTARARTSGENLFVVLLIIDPTSHELGSPVNSGRFKAHECYYVIYDHNQDKLAKPLISMTIAEVQKSQRSWTKRFKSSAAGAAQYMRDTLKGLIAELKLSTSQIFDGNLQDRLAFHLLKRRGLKKFMTPAG